MKKFSIILYVSLIILFLGKNIVLYCFYEQSKNDNLDTFNLKKQYDIFVDLEENKLALFLDNCLIKEYSIASGKPSTPSPTGIWKITQKDDWGNGFGGSWMGLNVPWGTFGIHGTKNPGSIGANVSHGCIRMFNESAKELYNTVPIGTTVVISKGPYTPFGQNPRVMKPGDRGSDILTVQMTLQKLKFYNGSLDGVYGEGLKKALFAFYDSLGTSRHNEITTWDLKMMGIVPFE